MSEQSSNHGPFAEREPIDYGTEHGIEWATMRARMYGAANGYARLPEGHPWRSLDLTWNDSGAVDVHGGVTYGPDSAGWIGFDTLHAFDRWPGEDQRGVPVRGDHEYDIHWTDELVRREAVSLARAVALTVTHVDGEPVTTTPTLPSEPGAYRDTDGYNWLLDDYGDWMVDYTNNLAKVDNLERPTQALTRLGTLDEHRPIIAAEVIDWIENASPLDPSPREHFGVTS